MREELLLEMIGHFTEFGWAIRTNREKAFKVEKEFPFLLVKKLKDIVDDRPYSISLVKGKKIPDKILLEYYIKRLDEVKEEYNKLYAALKKVVDTY
jgi:hypothetical protein